MHRLPFRAAAAALLLAAAMAMAGTAPVARADTVSLRPVSVSDGVYAFRVRARQLRQAISARLVAGARRSKVDLSRLRADAAAGRTTRLRAPGRTARGGAAVRLRITRDRARPTAPRTLTARVAGGRAVLRWRASTDDTGVSAYRVYSAGRLITTVPAVRRHHAAPVVDGERYVFTVKARDRAGNLSRASHTVRLARPAVPVVPAAGTPGGGLDAGFGSGGDRAPDDVKPTPPDDPSIGKPVVYGALAHADEFTGGAGKRPANWTALNGGHGWGNNELQQFTSRKNNVSLNGLGQLAITARRETFTGTDGITRDYTSARVNTKSSFSFLYGHVEARMKVPSGRGMWPAFWGMGENVWDIGWPAAGELDITEILGKDPNTTYGTLHGPIGTTQTGWSIGGKFTAKEPLSADYHRYGVTWRPDGVEWSLDGEVFAALPRSALSRTARWVFDHPFYLILNLSVGGNWPGPPDAGTTFPKQLLVDWVRVYE